MESGAFQPPFVLSIERGKVTYVYGATVEVVATETQFCVPPVSDRSVVEFPANARLLRLLPLPSLKP